MYKSNSNEPVQAMKPNPQNSVAPTKGKSSKSIFVCSALSLACAVVVVYAFLKFKPKDCKPINTKATEYVFFNTDGKPVILSERDVYGIQQMNDDGVLPSSIGEHYNLSTVMVCRIINCTKALRNK